MRTIRVTGKGQIKVKPDITRITMTLTGVFKEYSETLRPLIGGYGGAEGRPFCLRF